MQFNLLESLRFPYFFKCRSHLKKSQRSKNNKTNKISKTCTIIRKQITDRDRERDNRYIF